MQGFIGIGDQGDEHAEDHIDEECYEDVEIDLGENKRRHRDMRHFLVSRIHVVTIDKREETLRGDRRVTELRGCVCGWVHV